LGPNLEAFFGLFLFFVYPKHANNHPINTLLCPVMKTGESGFVQIRSDNQMLNLKGKKRGEKEEDEVGE